MRIRPLAGPAADARRLDCRIDVAIDGAEAVNIVGTCDYDIVFIVTPELLKQAFENRHAAVRRRRHAWR